MADVGKNYQAQARTGPGVATPLVVKTVAENFLIL